MHGEDGAPGPPRASLEEMGGRRICGLAERPLASVRVTADRVALDVGDLEGGIELRVRVPFHVDGPGGRVELSPGRPGELGPLLGLVARPADRLTVDASGGLELRFSDGTALRVPGGGFVRGWDVQGAGDLEAARPFLQGA